MGIKNSDFDVVTARPRLNPTDVSYYEAFAKSVRAAADSVMAKVGVSSANLDEVSNVILAESMISKINQNNWNSLLNGFRRTDVSDEQAIKYMQSLFQNDRVGLKGPVVRVYVDNYKYIVGGLNSSGADGVLPVVSEKVWESVFARVVRDAEADGTKLTVDQKKAIAKGIEDQANRDLPLSEYEARAIRLQALVDDPKFNKVLNRVDGASAKSLDEVFEELVQSCRAN